MTHPPESSALQTPEVGLDQAYASFLRVHDLIEGERRQQTELLCADSHTGVTADDFDPEEQQPMNREQFAQWLERIQKSPADVYQWMNHLAERVQHDPAAEDERESQGTLAG